MRAMLCAHHVNALSEWIKYIPGYHIACISCVEHVFRVPMSKLKAKIEKKCNVNLIKSDTHDIIIIDRPTDRQTLEPTDLAVSRNSNWVSWVFSLNFSENMFAIMGRAFAWIAHIFIVLHFMRLFLSFFLWIWWLNSDHLTEYWNNIRLLLLFLGCTSYDFFRYPSDGRKLYNLIAKERKVKKFSHIVISFVFSFFF